MEKNNNVPQQVVEEANGSKLEPKLSFEEAANGSKLERQLSFDEEEEIDMKYWKLERQISFEEPKTLSAAELTRLREAALEIFNTRTPEEAAKFFMGGANNVVEPAATEKVEPAATTKN